MVAEAGKAEKKTQRKRLSTLSLFFRKCHCAIRSSAKTSHDFAIAGIAFVCAVLGRLCIPGEEKAVIFFSDLVTKTGG